MGLRTLSLDRVLVTTVSTGAGTLELGPAVPGYADLSLAGAVSGRRYSFATLDAVGAGGAPSNWEFGVGVATLSGGVWTLTRPLIRKRKDGGTTPVNWGPGTKWVFFGISAADVPLLDSDGWLGLGGDPGRELVAPLDVRAAAPGTGHIANFANAAGDSMFNVRDGIIYTGARMRVLAPLDPADAANRAYADGTALRNVVPVYQGATAGLGADPTVSETTLFNMAIPPNVRAIYGTASINVLIGSGSPATVTFAAYVMNAANGQVGIILNAAAPGGAGQYQVASWPFGYTAPAGANTAGWYLQFRAFRNQPAIINAYTAMAFNICEGN